MLDAFSAHLEARNPAKGHFRSYRMEAGTDLFGEWVVEVNFGRIGSRGHDVRYIVGNVAEAKKLVVKTLRLRSTAKKRIGTDYRILELHDPHAWVSPESA